MIASRRVSPDLIFYNIRSTDFGQNWLQPVELFRAAQSSMTDQIEFEGLVHYVWAGRFVWEGPWETYYIRSIDGGISWSESVALSEIDDYGSYHPSISVNELGYVGLSWLDFKYSPYWFTGDIFARQSFNFGEEWTPEVQITQIHQSTLSDIVFSGDTVCVIWQDERTQNGRYSIYYSESTDSGLSWSEEFRLDPDELESRNPAVATSNGKVYVIWADDRSYPPADIYPGIYFRKYEEGTSIEESANVPQTVSLGAYPNPFNSSTTITYANLPAGAIGIYNVAGQKVATLPAAAAEGQVTWDATDATGAPASSGIYFVRAVGLSGAQAIKLVYLK